MAPSQPVGVAEAQAWLSVLTASAGAWSPESAIWRNGVVISAGTPALDALETSFRPLAASVPHLVEPAVVFFCSTQEAE